MLEAPKVTFNALSVIMSYCRDEVSIHTHSILDIVHVHINPETFMDSFILFFDYRKERF